MFVQCLMWLTSCTVGWRWASPSCQMDLDHFSAHSINHSLLAGSYIKDRDKSHHWKIWNNLRMDCLLGSLAENNTISAIINFICFCLSWIVKYGQYIQIYIYVAYFRGCQKARGRPLHMAPYKKEPNQVSSLYTISTQFLYNILTILCEISWTDFFWGLCPRHMASY